MLCMNLKKGDWKLTWIDNKISIASLFLINRQGEWLPDALGGVDDGLHYAVSNELPVLLRDVIDRCLRAKPSSSEDL